ncbi:caspase family protein [Flavobacterium sp. N502540]|uniref:caspase family protein n=1 Tax=Flavobacterium sp. N502540 TaxID=2986838 RepID=UPI0022251F8B|nr:caspase family protein [Flavobacterium sp. N502540]
MKIYPTLLLCFLLNLNVLGQKFNMHVNLSSKDQTDRVLVSANQKYLFTSCQRQNEIKVWDIQNKANVCTIDTKRIFNIGFRTFFIDVNPNSNELLIFFPEAKKIIIYDFLNNTIISEYNISNDLVYPFNKIFYCDYQSVYLIDDTYHEFEILKYNLKTKTKQLIKKYLKENQLDLKYIEKTNENIVCFFEDNTNYLVQSSNDQLLLKVKKPEKFNNIEPAISKDEHYIALSYTDSICIFNTKTMSRQVIDSTKFMYRDYYPTSVRFSDDCKKLLYLDNNDGSIGKELIVVYDLEQNKIINKISVDGRSSIQEFYESKEQIFATEYSVIYSGYLFQYKLHKLLKGLERQTSSFAKSGPYWITGFDNGSISFFNTKTGENNSLKITKSGNAYESIESVLHFDQTVIVSVAKRDNIFLYKIDIKNLKVLDSVQIFDTGKFEDLQIDNKNEKLWLKLETDNRLSEDFTTKRNIKNFLFDVTTLKEIPLFENQNYSTIYYTQDKKEIVGYVREKGSFVYDSKNYKFIKFIPSSLYFKYKENQYELIKEIKDNLVKNTYVNCDKCENGYLIIDSIFKEPSGLLILKKNSIKIMEFDNFNKEPKSENDLFYFQITQNANTISFSKNGFETFVIDLEKQTFSIPYKIRKYIFKYDKPPFYLKFDVSDKENIRNVIKSNTTNFKNSDTLKVSIYSINYVNELSYVTKEFNGNFDSWSNNGYDDYGNIKIELFDKAENGAQRVRSEDSDDPNEFDNLSLTLNSLDPKSLYKEKKLGLCGEFSKNPVITLEDKVFLNKASAFKRDFSGNKHSKTSNTFIAINMNYLFDDDIKTSPFNYTLSDITYYYDWKKKSTDLYNVSWNENQIALRGSYEDPSKVNFNFIFLKDNNFIIFFDDNYYMATREIFDFLWFSNSDKIFRPEQFDLKFNRPDIVMQRLGYADLTTVQFFKNLYLKRLNKIGYKENQSSNSLDLPTLKIEKLEKIEPIISSKEIGLNLQIKDSKYRLKSILIWINNTPVYGKNGMDVSKLKTKKLNKLIQLDLADGDNKIQISVLNEIGLESLKETVYINSKQTNANPNLYLVTIGVSEFDNSAYNLKYAAKDASDIKILFAQSNLYTNVYTKTLLNTEVTQEKVLKLVEFLKNAKINDIVIIYIASHGILDKEFNYYIASHNIDFHNPIKKGISYESIESLLDKIKPLKKIMFIDACHSGEVDVEETERTETEIAIDQTIEKRGAKPINVKKETINQLKTLNEELFSDLRRGNGTTIISSAGGLEYALESDKWKNGLFTYCLINGLLSKEADLDKNGSIMLSEIQSYVSNQVKELSNGSQQPTFRLQNLATDYQIW